MSTLHPFIQMLANLERDKRKLSSLHFPLDLATEGTGNIIRISINIPSGSNYVANGRYQQAVHPKTGKIILPGVARSGSQSLRRRFSENYMRTTTEIDLFMPARIQSNYQADWGQEDLGMAGAALDAGFALSQVDSMSDAEQVWETVKRTIPEALVNAFAGTAGAITQLNLTGARKLYNDTMVNPYVEVVFNGIQNRTFSFTFKMSPRNKEEQEMIRRIVKELKFHRAPELKFPTQSNYWLFPSTFDIQFLNRTGENPWLFKISTCALTGFEVDYTPDGAYSVHKEGAPSGVEMTLTFTEMEQLTKQRILDGF